MGKRITDLKKLWPMIAAAVGVLLMLLPSFLPKKSTAEAATDIQKEAELYSERLEKKVTELISAAAGVGEARVVVTLDGTGESVWAQNESVSDKSVTVDYVILSGENGEEPLPVAEIYPKVRGVAVVCKGGESAEVRKRVTELISAALGITANKIAVSG